MWEATKASATSSARSIKLFIVSSSVHTAYRRELLKALTLTHLFLGLHSASRRTTSARAIGARNMENIVRFKRNALA